MSETEPPPLREKVLDGNFFSRVWIQWLRKLKADLYNINDEAFILSMIDKSVTDKIQRTLAEAESLTYLNLVKRNKQVKVSVQIINSSMAETIGLVPPVKVGEAFVISDSKGSAGTVAATGNMNVAGVGPSNLTYDIVTSGLSGGTTDLTVKVYSGVLSDDVGGYYTTLTTDGPCRCQVVWIREG